MKEIAANGQTQEGATMNKCPFTIRCNQCLWHGDEDSLLRCEDASGDGLSDACPICRTDHFLMDLDGTETQFEPTATF